MESAGAALSAVGVAMVLVGLINRRFDGRGREGVPGELGRRDRVARGIVSLGGNLLLKGWTVSNISFVTTDLPFYVVGVAIKGLNPSLLRDIPSAVYAVAVGTAVLLAAWWAVRQGWRRPR